MRGYSFYQTKHLAVIPMMPGTAVYRDGVLSSLYYRTRDEGKLSWAFCGDLMNHDQFIEFFQKRKTLQCLCEVENDKTLKIAGYSWVDNPRGVDGCRALLCGFCFFQTMNRPDSARNLARLAVAYACEELKADVIQGVQLASNIAARNFSQRIGFKEVAVVPNWHFHDGELVPARVMMLTAQEYLPKFWEWFDKQEKP